MGAFIVATGKFETALTGCVLKAGRNSAGDAPEINEPVANADSTTRLAMVVKSPETKSLDAIDGLTYREIQAKLKELGQPAKG